MCDVRFYSLQYINFLLDESFIVTVYFRLPTARNVRKGALILQKGARIQVSRLDFFKLIVSFKIKQILEFN